MKYLLTPALALLATGCASVITPATQQTIQVNSDPQGARCQLVNDKGIYTVPSTPGSITVTKTEWPGLLGNQLVVTCTKGTLVGSDRFASLPRGWGWVSGGGGGLTALADRQSGMGYPDSVMIPLKAAQ